MNTTKIISTNLQQSRPTKQIKHRLYYSQTQGDEEIDHTVQE
jgi:hypothetical protein